MSVVRIHFWTFLSFFDSLYQLFFSWPVELLLQPSHVLQSTLVLGLLVSLRSYVFTFFSSGQIFFQSPYDLYRIIREGAQARYERTRQQIPERFLFLQTTLSAASAVAREDASNAFNSAISFVRSQQLSRNDVAETFFNFSREIVGWQDFIQRNRNFLFGALIGGFTFLIQRPEVIVRIFDFLRRIRISPIGGGGSSIISSPPSSSSVLRDLFEHLVQNQDQIVSLLREFFSNFY